VFFDAGVAAMRVEHYQINLTQRRVSHASSGHVVASISIIVNQSIQYQYSIKTNEKASNKSRN
jgi:hypothetical protein